MNKIIMTLVCFGITSISDPNAYAQEKGDIVIPCAIPFYRELDFTVGEWQVFHKSTGKIAGYDRIGRTLRGCAIQQSWISLDDHFSSKYVPFRMNGKSLTAFNGTEWIQFWVDNQAGVQILKGGPKRDQFVLQSEKPIAGYEYMLIWQKQEDGSLLNTHKRRNTAENKNAEWETLYEWVYVKNLNQDLYPDEIDENN